MDEGDNYSIKVLGRKGQPPVDLQAIDGMQRLANTLSYPRRRLPKGLYRFKTFEEADAWLMNPTPNR